MGYFDTIYADSSMPHRAKAVYMYLKDRMNSERKCWPGIRRIAADLHLSRSTIKRAIKELEQGGYIQRTRRNRENGGSTSNLYFLK